MGTTAEKLTHLSQTKSDIRDAIEAKGVSVPAETTFRDYATKVSDIKTDYSDTFDYAERVSQDGGSVENLSEVSKLDFNDGATLNFIPSGKKAGKAYSQVPTNGSGDWTVDRNCEATYIGQDGLIKTALANEPRYDWSSGKPVLLREGQSTNLINDSGFNNWSLAGASKIHNFGVAPNGLGESVKIEDSGSGSFNAGYKTSIPTSSIGDIYTASIYIKNINVNQCSIRVISGNTDARLLKLGHEVNNWSKLSLTFTANDTNSNVYIYPTGIGYPESGAIEVWGVQIEKGSAPTSYIKTEGATVTRLADTITTTPPAGTTQIIETIDGVEQAPITTIPATYQIPEGNINQIKML